MPGVNQVLQNKALGKLQDKVLGYEPLMKVADSIRQAEINQLKARKIEESLATVNFGINLGEVEAKVGGTTQTLSQVNDKTKGSRIKSFHGRRKRRSRTECSTYVL